ncbi:hypothetical protein AB0C69_36670, partial [Actinomadura sp. NPDC048032]|uniref:hypothetical protein n=1 Tax=Actinomadura sp. NPDC048032 TaxID=3155747 RepID=UPI003410C6B9
MAAAALTPDGRAPGRPQPQGLYDPANEHDACGVGMVADLHGRKSHDIVQNALPDDPMPAALLRRRHLIGLREAYEGIHRPRT